MQKIFLKRKGSLQEAIRQRYVRQTQQLQVCELLYALVALQDEDLEKVETYYKAAHNHRIDLHARAKELTASSDFKTLKRTNSEEIFLTLLFSLLSLLLSSCHSTLAYGLTGTQEPFAGTQAIVIMPVPDSPEYPASTGDKAAWYTFKVVDFPFTLVADCFWWPMSVYYKSEYDKTRTGKTG